MLNVQSLACESEEKTVSSNMGAMAMNIEAIVPTILNYGFNIVKEYEAFVERFELFVGAAEHERVLALEMMIDDERMVKE